MQVHRTYGLLTPNQNIRVNSISPGYVRTEMTAAVSFQCILIESELIDSSPIFSKNGSARR